MEQVKMWASERELLRLAVLNLDFWREELCNCDEIRLNGICARLLSVIEEMKKLHANSKSEQAPPSQL